MCISQFLGSLSNFYVVVRGRGKKDRGSFGELVKTTENYKCRHKDLLYRHNDTKVIYK